MRQAGNVASPGRLLHTVVEKASIFEAQARGRAHEEDRGCHGCARRCGGLCRRGQLWLVHADGAVGSLQTESVPTRLRRRPAVGNAVRERRGRAARRGRPGGSAPHRRRLPAGPLVERRRTRAGGVDVQRSSDPWVSFSPNGVVHQISLSFNDTNADNAILASRSTDGGLTWSEPATLFRENTGSGSLFVDKEAITADPFDSRFVYAVWDRSTFPSDTVSLTALQHTFALRSRTVFARTTNGGASWEPARPIFDEQRAISFTIGNQIAVVPSGGSVPTLVNEMFLFHGSGVQLNCCEVAVLRSTDRGVTWSGAIQVSNVDTVGVVDPDTGQAVRTGDIIPDIAAGVSPGRVYA